MTTTTRSPRPSAARTRAAARPTRRARRPRREPRALPYLLLLPATAVLALVLGYPLTRLGVISFQDYGLRALFTGQVGWAGLANYRAIADDPQLVPVLLRTAGFCAALVAGTLGVGLAVALMMVRLGPAMRRAVTFCLIASWAMPPVAGTLVWQWLFEPVYGVVNWALTQTGLFGDLSQHDWTSSPLSAFALVWLLVVWQSVPFVALTLYAGLSQIPRSYYEAAALDGAGPWRTFRVITLPFLRPILALVTILSVIWDFNVFTQIWILTQGGPNQGTTTLGIWSFTKAFSSDSFGQGAAVAVVSVLLLFGITVVYVRRLVRSGEEL
ncbi:carbohydrate ABC transporter permease [Streptacidiphilus jiangxiensis]|uniref:N,N'-diacetylchitobiose transport system permease protein n=1 Tax=Streptacidiphilus jiangxiensis TaxID=235985 RepID=A0A1H7UA10_STRJI|nr:sugar ABC transporter permease [Streptacidiphilus jiangxiensis]SEL93117.1 N,N'-diacetylchitobiose transport system permease protein [Streptacidiphilus jiangxiensis]